MFVVFGVEPIAKGFGEFGGNIVVCAYNFCGTPRNLFIGVVAGRVACPDDEINLVFDIFGDPFESLVDQSEGCIAIRGFSTIIACRSFSSMARALLVRGGMGSVEGIWM